MKLQIVGHTMSFIHACCVLTAEYKAEVAMCFLGLILMESILLCYYINIGIYITIKCNKRTVFSVCAVCFGPSGQLSGTEVHDLKHK
jgi:hypothetical protein